MTGSPRAREEMRRLARMVDYISRELLQGLGVSDRYELAALLLEGLHPECPCPFCDWRAGMDELTRKAVDDSLASLPAFSPEMRPSE